MARPKSPHPDTRIAIDHRHEVGGAFRTGFGLALGWYVAAIVVILTLTVISVVVVVATEHLLEGRAKTTKQIDPPRPVETGTAEVNPNVVRRDTTSPRTQRPTPQEHSSRGGDEDFEIESLTLQMVEGNARGIKYGWRFRLRNYKDYSMVGSAEVKLVDANGTAVGTATVNRIVIPPQEAKEFTGTTEVRMPAADKVTSATVDISLR